MGRLFGDCQQQNEKVKDILIWIIDTVDIGFCSWLYGSVWTPNTIATTCWQTDTMDTCALVTLENALQMNLVSCQHRWMCAFVCVRVSAW